MSPALETAERNQKAVYWSASGFDDRGDITIDAAVDIDVRWEKVNGSIVDANGNNISFDATAVVDRVVPDGSVFWQGEISDLPGTGTETPTSDIFHSVKYTETPDLKGRNFRRVVLLSRLSDELPALT